mmetsp:Transcript_51695/g.149078  ORF Transcript_51695/g.149078 Transcript_51695/m.149078 type:complete len:474 (-) Transcript_51695:51-1472(-)
MSHAEVLQQWASAGLLRQATLNSEGTELSCNGTTLPANEKVTISHAEKSCEYTLASIYLQIIDPEQALVGYRGACKKHNVKDPVKASDKATVVGFFLGSADSAAAPAPPAAAPEAPAPAVAEEEAPDDEEAKEKAREKDRKHRSSKEKEKHRKDKHHHRHDKKRSHSASRSEEKKKKAPKTINTETLFSNLVTVVDKRSAAGTQKKEETAQLMAALSTDGFEVTPELLKDYKEKSDAIVANEIPVGNSASILKAAAGKDLSRILKLYLEVMQPKTSGKSSSVSNKTLGQKKAWRTYLVGQKPIIIVPKGMTAPITLLNAHEFFGNSRYVPRDVLMKKGFHKTNVATTFTRRVGQRLGGGVVEYEIMDNPKSKLPTAKDWERVVAVVCLGQSWQFKDWPGHYKDPVRLFSSVFGFYCGMEGAKVPDELNSWAVTQAKLNRDKRGLDSVTYASFWNGVDEYMAIHKPEMLPQPEA